MERIRSPRPNSHLEFHQATPNCPHSDVLVPLIWMISTHQDPCIILLENAPSKKKSWIPPFVPIRKLSLYCMSHPSTRFCGNLFTNKQKDITSLEEVLNWYVVSQQSSRVIEEKCCFSNKNNASSFFIYCRPLFYRAPCTCRLHCACCALLLIHFFF